MARASSSPRAEASELRGAPELPGPPGSATAPRSADPAVKEVEERLFQTDAGRVVLKAIRAHGGWERWQRVMRVTAVIRSSRGSMSPGSEPGGSVPAAATSLERKLVWSAAAALDPEENLELYILAAPFSFAKFLDLEYLGVEADPASGETYDKVELSPKEPGARWFVAYFSRRTGLLERLVYPRPLEGGTPGAVRFTRVHFTEHKRSGELWLATRWTTFSLRNRYARADLDQPERDERLLISVDSDPGEKLEEP